MSLRFERAYPWLLALLAVGIAWGFGISMPKAHRFELLSASISVGAILAGFLTTAKAIFMALPVEPRTSIKATIKESTYIDNLASYLAQGIWSCLAFSLLNLVGFFFPQSMEQFFDVLWCGLVTLSFAAFARVTHIMLLLFKAV